MPPALLEVQSSFCTNNTVGTCSAELVCPYPPGIPLRVAAERVSAGALAELHAQMDGCSGERDGLQELSTTLQARLSETQQELAALNEAKVEAEERLANVQLQLGGQVNELSASIAKLEQRLAYQLEQQLVG